MAAVSEGCASRPGPLPYSREAVRQEIVRLLKANEKPAKIAAQVGCSTQTIYRARRALEGLSGAPEAETDRQGSGAAA